MQKILFVCTGNICRSPTAHAIARSKAKNLGLENELFFDSAATSSYHCGQSPDSRSAEVGKARNISFSGIFSRQITDEDFKNFDYIFCMDRSHLSTLYSISNPKYHNKIHLFLEFCAVNNFWDDEVVDPYYGAKNGFSEVFDMIEKATDSMFEIILPAP